LVGRPDLTPRGSLLRPLHVQRVNLLSAGVAQREDGAVGREPSPLPGPESFHKLSAGGHVADRLNLSTRQADAVFPSGGAFLMDEDDAFAVRRPLEITRPDVPRQVLPGVQVHIEELQPHVVILDRDQIPPIRRPLWREQTAGAGDRGDSARLQIHDLQRG